ncbi:MAG: SHOCT domain-containing protein [Thaumarchaeota archaeon]|nr:SHOCT domain-containing protein [Nitrososphaerota archaeon]
MNRNEMKRPGHYFGWALVAVAMVAVVAFALSWFFVPRPLTGYFYPFAPFGWFFGLFWIFIIFWAVRWIFWGPRWGYHRWYGRHGDESYYILRERYAKGEITREQFDQMMRDLENRS